MRRVAIAIMLFLCTTSLQAASQYEQIKEWGEVAIALKGDYRPFGFHNVEGDLIGIEVDLAENIANDLGVRLRKIQATSANRLEFLRNGRVDVVLATMTDTEERRRIVTVIEPNYYSSGVSLLLPRNSAVKTWEDLKGQKVCVLENAIFNAELEARYGFQSINYESTTAGIEAMKDGKCAGWMFEEAFILAEIAHAKSENLPFPYHAPLKTILSQPWAIAIRKEEGDNQLKVALANIIAEWHRSGRLMELHEKWNMPVTEFLREKNRIWNERNAAGEYLCSVTAAGDITPNKCK